MRNTAEEIFADALEMDSSRRAEFLASACEGDSDLLAEVQAMLRDAESAETFFESMTRGAVGNPAFEAVPPSDRQAHRSECINSSVFWAGEDLARSGWPNNPDPYAVLWRSS